VTSRSNSGAAGRPSGAGFSVGIDPDLLGAARRRFDADGVVPGAIVAWLSHNRWEMLAALAECERRGAVLLPLNWRLAAAELARIVAHAGAGHLMSAPETDSLAREIAASATLHPGPATGVQAGDLLLVYTSGTTGEPKGALHTDAGMRANRDAAIEAQGFDTRTRVLSVLPLFHVGGLCIQTLPVLAVGGGLRLHARFDADAWFDDVAAWRPTTSLLVPAVMRALVEHPRWTAADLSSLAFVNSGSQIVPRDLIEAFHARGLPVAQVYGATETGPVSIVLRPEEAMDHPGRAGRPARGVRVRLGPDGEILLKAPNLMRGYLRAGAASFDAGGWFHTGDLARRHADGFYEVVGRSKELIISGGENIHPAEIEQLVQGLPWVAECAVIGLPDERWGEVPVLALVPRTERAPSHDEGMAQLQALFDAQLARFKHPRRVAFLDALPRTALGKVQRSLVRARCAGPDALPQ
jgi:fatty-acyl-CoA synthase